MSCGNLWFLIYFLHQGMKALAIQPKSPLPSLTVSSKPRPTKAMLSLTRSVGVPQPLSPLTGFNVIGSVLTYPRKPPSWLLNVSETIKACLKILLHATTYPKRTDLGNIPRYNARENKTQLYGEQGGDCNGCGEHFQMQHLEIDHIIAKSVGGTDHIENLQLLCGHCNRIKGDRGQEYLISRLNVS